MFTLVLPACNEAERLERCVYRVRKTLSGKKYEIIIAEDGSTDGTDKIASELAEKYQNITYLHSDKRLGRGNALKRAFKIARGDVVGYMDVDLATDIKHLKSLINYTKKYDVVTGSRYLESSKSKRTEKRKLFSFFYNLLVRVFLKSKLYDHQCGFKALKKNVALRLNMDVKSKHWFWDTEILVLAQRRGYKVKEFPVNWKEGDKTKVRLKNDAVDMGMDVLKLWWRLRKE